MCGICGQYNYRNGSPVLLDDIQRMTNTIVHRGPDDEGYYLSGNIGFGFRRLSIIDLSGGHQPMSDNEKNIWVIFNGEIYNYKSLKEELEGFGYVFRTKSDTEVLVHGYKQWGRDLFNRLNGMFGLAIWDQNKEELVLARDPMGIKLVYYQVENGSVFFGSEIRPILSSKKSSCDIDPTALNLFLRYRYTPSPLTLLKGIKKLAPGSMLIVRKDSCRLEHWYNYRPAPFSPMKTDAQAKEELLELYKHAIERQLMSDVPLGLLLSGGIDSGLLLGLMSIHGKHWPTFSIGYGSSFKDDELIDAARTAEIFSAKHTSMLISRDEFEAHLEKIVACLEEPIASSSIVPMYFICQRASQDVKVALVGQGPDELFGGYKRHLGIHYGDFWRRLPKRIRNYISKHINLFGRNEALRRGAYALGIEDRLIRYRNTFSINSGSTINALFKDGLVSEATGDSILDCWESLIPFLDQTDEIGGLNFLEVHSSLPDELLMYADKLSMAHGLEIRVPYLDKEIVEYAENLSSSFKVRHFGRKWLHRKVCRDFLPGEIINRKKRGFAVNVVDSWFSDSLSKKMEDIFLDTSSYMYDFLQPEPVKQLLDSHKTKRRDNHKLLFSLVVFEEWLRSKTKF